MLSFFFYIFMALLIIGVPIGYVFGITAIAGFIKLDNPLLLNIVARKFFFGINTYVFVAIPMFLIAGEAMTRSGITVRLIEFTNVLFGWLRGALAQVNIMTSIIFGGISGASVADTAALGSIFIPAMEKEGYNRAFSTAVTLASSIISPIIPPSIILIIYGAISGVSIAGLFAAGLVPGIVMGIGLMIWTHIIAKKQNFKKHAITFSLKNLFVATKRAIFALALPFIIVGGILGGVVTPTEAAALAAGYALFVGCVIYRSLSWRDLYQIFFNAAVLMGIITLIVASASIVGWFLASERIPESVAKLFLSFSSNKYMVLLLINIMMIIIGMFLDINAALIILTPILAPIAIKIGVHPFQFGVVMCINLAIALLTPPMGGGLYVAMSVGRVELVPLLKNIWPYILVEYAVLFLVTYIPPLTMAIPTLLGFVK